MGKCYTSSKAKKFQQAFMLLVLFLLVNKNKRICIIPFKRV
jgi:hypothetical protein